MSEPQKSAVPPPKSTSPSGRSGDNRPTDETIKETLEAIVVAFILAFVFRAYVVEAFVIPTGSMAPTLLGEHIDVVCPECGYRFAVDAPTPEEWRSRLATAGNPTISGSVICPMCRFPIPMPRSFRASAGDRILVHKYIYSIVDPGRWDVVVFKNPQDPNVNFIKRLVGLPGESLEIIDGDLYVHPPGQEWHIARKPDRPKVQRAVWQPIYHSSYVPLDQGKRSPARVIYPWQTPWIPDHSADWNVDGLRDYRHVSAASGKIKFSFPLASASGAGWYPYNEFRTFSFSEPIEDVRIAASFQPDKPGLAIQLQTTARLDSESTSPSSYTLIARIDSQGHALLEARGPDGSSTVRPLKAGQTKPFAPGQTRRVELWYVDQQASLWVDGQRLLVQNFDLSSIHAAELRAPPTLYPQIAIEVSGSPVTLHRVELDRDIFYSSGRQQRGPTAGEPGWGVLIKEGDRRYGGPVTLDYDEFFCLGDNSPMSHDGRYWNVLNPWIEKRLFEDAGLKQKLGVVPRKLMMGKAFFVYFPAPFALTPGGPSVFPNFGDMRFIH